MLRSVRVDSIIYIGVEIVHVLSHISTIYISYSLRKEAQCCEFWDIGDLAADLILAAYAKVAEAKVH